MESELRKELIFAENYEQIYSIVIKMIDNDISVEKYLNSTIYRILVLKLNQVNNYHKLKNIIENKQNEKINNTAASKVNKPRFSKIKLRDIKKELKRKLSVRQSSSKFINYKINNVSKPYQGGSVSPK